MGNSSYFFIKHQNRDQTTGEKLLVWCTSRQHQSFKMFVQNLSEWSYEGNLLLSHHICHTEVLSCHTMKDDALTSWRAQVVLAAAVMTGSVWSQDGWLKPMWSLSSCALEDVWLWGEADRGPHHAGAGGVLQLLVHLWGEATTEQTCHLKQETKQKHWVVFSLSLRWWCGCCSPPTGGSSFITLWTSSTWFLWSPSTSPSSLTWRWDRSLSSETWDDSYRYTVPHVS